MQGKINAQFKLHLSLHFHANYFAPLPVYIVEAATATLFRYHDVRQGMSTTPEYSRLRRVISMMEIYVLPRRECRIHYEIDTIVTKAWEIHDRATCWGWELTLPQKFHLYIIGFYIFVHVYCTFSREDYRANGRNVTYYHNIYCQVDAVNLFVHCHVYDAEVTTPTPLACSANLLHFKRAPLLAFDYTTRHVALIPPSLDTLELLRICRDSDKSCTTIDKASIATIISMRELRHESSHQK